MGPTKEKMKYMYTYFEHIPRTLHFKLLSKYYIAVHYKLWKYFSVSFEIIWVVFLDFAKSFFKDNQSLEIHIQIKFLGWFGCVCWPNKLNEAQSWPQSRKNWTFFQKFLEILTCNKTQQILTRNEHKKYILSIVENLPFALLGQGPGTWNFCWWAYTFFHPISWVSSCWTFGFQQHHHHHQNRNRLLSFQSQATYFSENICRLQHNI